MLITVLCVKLCDVLGVHLLTCCVVSLQPLVEWSAGNVVDWMAAINLSYTELFKSKDIKGADLISLNEEKLEVSLIANVYIVLFILMSLSNTSSPLFFNKWIATEISTRKFYKKCFIDCMVFSRYRNMYYDR